MKRTISGMLFFGMIMSASLWAHHMAEGIISDELWNSIDESLEGTPHDEILSLSGPDMDVQTDADTGTIFLESVVRVDFEELVRAVDYESLVQEVIDLYVLPAVDAMNRIPSVTVISTPEQIDSRMLFITYELVDDGVFEIATVIEGHHGYTFAPVKNDWPPAHGSGGGRGNISFNQSRPSPPAAQPSRASTW